MDNESKEVIIRCAYDELIKIEGLKAHPKNPNKHSDDQILRLAKIIEYQGIRRPVRVSRLSGFLTAGQGLVLALRHLKCTTVPVNFQDYDSEDQEIADLVCDNAIASWSSLDLSFINLFMADFDPSFDLDMLGLKDFKVDASEKPQRGCPQCGYVKIKE